GPAPGPDYNYGWGLMNAERAAQLLSHVAAGGDKHLLQQNVLNNSATFSTTVVASGLEPLRFTICWNDPAAVGSDNPVLDDFTPRLINDLDLRITDNQTGQVFFPWTMPYQQNPANTANVATQTALQNADNNRDNVEQVVVFNPIPGRTYTVTVTHKGTLTGGSQEYAIIGSGIMATPLGTSGALNPADSRIENVTFGSLNNTSNLLGICAAYSDFRSSVTPPNLQIGSTVNLSVTLGTCGAFANKHVRVFV
ncbi:MAG: peptidase S8, partial [Cytophagales bacterium]|nr:peptidase S8 [Bernardetiaceae bacterium]MDW8206178.1 peptidase S8 [Cytophagales bacterium]